jgi:probable rRNA maturation factor
MFILESAINGVSAATMQRFARRAQKLAAVRGDVDILVSDNHRLQALNRHFRGKNKPTDVLSFPRTQGGDIAISADIARQNAALYGHSVADELKILTLHGLLHLAGHDHESDSGEMAQLESRLRAQLKLPDSLIDRAHASAKTAPGKNRSAKRRVKQSAKLKHKSKTAPSRNAAKSTASSRRKASAARKVPTASKPSATSKKSRSAQ